MSQNDFTPGASLSLMSKLFAWVGAGAILFAYHVTGLEVLLYLILAVSVQPSAHFFAGFVAGISNPAAGYLGFLFIRSLPIMCVFYAVGAVSNFWNPIPPSPPAITGSTEFSTNVRTSASFVPWRAGERMYVDLNITNGHEERWAQIRFIACEFLLISRSRAVPALPLYQKVRLPYNDSTRSEDIRIAPGQSVSLRAQFSQVNAALVANQFQFIRCESGRSERMVVERAGWQGATMHN